MSSKHNRRRSEPTRLLAIALLFYRNQSAVTAEELALRNGFDLSDELHSLQAKVASLSLIEPAGICADSLYQPTLRQLAMSDGEPGVARRQLALADGEPELTS